MTALAEELRGAHPVTGTYSDDATTAAEQLNAENIASQRPLTNGDLMAWGALGPRANIQDSADTGTRQVRAISLSALDLLRSGEPLDLTKYSGLIAALIGAGVITQAESDQLTALSAITISRAQQLGLTVTPGEVERARA